MNSRGVVAGWVACALALWLVSGCVGGQEEGGGVSDLGGADGVADAGEDGLDSGGGEGDDLGTSPTDAAADLGAARDVGGGGAGDLGPADSGVSPEDLAGADLGPTDLGTVPDLSGDPDLGLDERLAIPAPAGPFATNVDELVATAQAQAGDDGWYWSSWLGGFQRIDDDQVWHCQLGAVEHRVLTLDGQRSNVLFTERHGALVMPERTASGFFVHHRTLEGAAQGGEWYVPADAMDEGTCLSGAGVRVLDLATGAWSSDAVGPDSLPAPGEGDWRGFFDAAETHLQRTEQAAARTAPARAQLDCHRVEVDMRRAAAERLMTFRNAIAFNQAVAWAESHGEPDVRSDPDYLERHALLWANGADSYVDDADPATPVRLDEVVRASQEDWEACLRGDDGQGDPDPLNPVCHWEHCVTIEDPLQGTDGDPATFSIDQVQWVGIGDPNVGNWAQTTSIRNTRIWIEYFAFEHDNPWNDLGIAAFGGNVELKGMGWILVQVQGQWYGAAIDWWGVDYDLVHIGNLNTADPDLLAGTPLERWQPRSGETYGFMVSGLAAVGLSNVQERSNVDFFVWPHCGENDTYWCTE